MKLVVELLLGALWLVFSFLADFGLVLTEVLCLSFIEARCVNIVVAYTSPTPRILVQDFLLLSDLTLVLLKIEFWYDSVVNFIDKLILRVLGVTVVGAEFFAVDRLVVLGLFWVRCWALDRLGLLFDLLIFNNSGILR